MNREMLVYDSASSPAYILSVQCVKADGRPSRAGVFLRFLPSYKEVFPCHCCIVAWSRGNVEPPFS